MVVHHPGYQNKIFLALSDSVKLGDEIPKTMQPALRFQMKDYPKSKLKELLQFPGGKPIDPEVEDMGLLNEYGKFGSLEGLVEAFTSGTFFDMHDVELKLGKTTQELIDQDGNIIVLGVKEYDELV